MKPKPAQRKPKVSPETAAARALNRARWKKTTPEERSEFARWVSAQRTSEQLRSDKRRCPCGVMTLKRAEARGRTWEHAAGCTFHPETALEAK